MTALKLIRIIADYITSSLYCAKHHVRRRAGKIRNEMTKEMFTVKRNDDAKRFEFAPTGDWIGYTVSFSECDGEEDNAWICVWKAFKGNK